MSSKPSEASARSSAANGSRANSLAARAADLPRSAWLLVAANVVPLVGVLLFGWDLGAIMILFWAENVVIGVFAILRIALVARWLAVFLVPFFTLHYGLFTMGHGVFIFALFASDVGVGDASRVILPGALALFLSHGASFVMNFLRGGEMERIQAAIGSLRWKKTGPNSWTADTAPGAEVTHARGFADAGSIMTAPYRRIVVLHLTIIAGGFLIMLLGEPRAALVFLVVLKTAVDLHAHLKERKRAAPATSGPET